MGSLGWDTFYSFSPRRRLYNSCVKEIFSGLYFFMKFCGCFIASWNLRVRNLEKCVLASFIFTKVIGFHTLVVVKKHDPTSFTLMVTRIKL